jgi:hypothetical protein
MRRRRVWLLVIGYWLLVSLLGCSIIKEVTRGFVGISTKALEDARGQAITKTFKYNYNTCYDKVKAALTAIGSYIYAEDKNKHMIAIFVSKTDTTAVGIFLKEIDANNTQVEVSSLSTYAKETVAKGVFSFLEGTFKSKEMKGQTDAKEEAGNKLFH